MGEKDTGISRKRQGEMLNNMDTTRLLRRTNTPRNDTHCKTNNPESFKNSGPSYFNYVQRLLLSPRQPLLEARALVLSPVAIAVAADGHVLAAGGETFGVLRGRRLFHLCASRLFDAGHFCHVKTRAQMTEVRRQNFLSVVSCLLSVLNPSGNSALPW